MGFKMYFTISTYCLSKCGLVAAYQNFVQNQPTPPLQRTTFLCLSLVQLKDYNSNKNTFRDERVLIKRVKRGGGGGGRHDKVHLLTHWPIRDRPHTGSQSSLWLRKEKSSKF